VIAAEIAQRQAADAGSGHAANFSIKAGTLDIT
jgi:hypothetical protein